MRFMEQQKKSTCQGRPFVVLLRHPTGAGWVGAEGIPQPTSLAPPLSNHKYKSQITTTMRHFTPSYQNKLLGLLAQMEADEQAHRNYLRAYNLPSDYTQPSTTKACQRAFSAHKRIFNQMEMEVSATGLDILGGFWK